MLVAHSLPWISTWHSLRTGRKAWLSFGSDDHASAAPNLFSVIVSCPLHGLDPEMHLAEIICVRDLEVSIARSWGRIETIKNHGS